MSTMKYIACIALTVCYFTPLASAQSRRDVKQIENTFNGFDKNKNGRVTQKEFLGFWESRFLATDKNEDGVLDQTEFLHAGNFQARDVNKDGVIELDEDLTVRERHWKAYRMGNKNWLSLDDYMRFVRGLPAPV